MNRIHQALRAFSWWHLGFLALILCLFGWVLYALVADSLAREADEQLILQAEGIAGNISAFREAEAGTRGAATGNWEHAPAGSFFGEAQRGQFPDLLARWARKTAALSVGRPFRLIDRAGEPILASDDFAALEIPLSARRVAEALGKHPSYETVRRRDQRFRLAISPVVERGRVLYLIQTAASLRPLDATVTRIALWLFWLIPLTLALAALVGWLLSNKTQRLVTLMTSQARRISAQHLETRLRVPDTGDQVERLAVTLNEMLERLERGFRQLRQFSAAASHELRTPLTAIRGELEVALRRPRRPEEYQQALRLCLQKAEEMSAMVEELLLLAYTEAGDRLVEWDPIELRALAEELCATWRPLADQTAIELALEALGPVWVQGERRLLERVLANLIDNALKYTPPAGGVTVRLGQDGPRAWVAVRDTGPGIPPEELPQLFDRFFQGRRRSNGGIPSTGLGLGLCRWIVELHRGRIEVSSAPPHGATFTVWLPLAEAPLEAPLIPVPEPPFHVTNP